MSEDKPRAITRAVVLQHTPTEGPARVEDLCRAQGIALARHYVYAGDPVPGHLDDDEMLVVMGGPMGVGDVGDPRYGFLAREIDLLRRLIAADRPVLGICLGAQLLAAAAGARVYPNLKRDRFGVLAPAREVGWAPVDFHNADSEPALAGLGPSATMLHWHSDTFDLPAGAVHLASTPDCAHQAFRLGTRQFGLQFHCELDADAVVTWVRDDDAFVRLAHGPAGGARILAETPGAYAQAQPACDRLLGNILAILAGP